MKPNYVDVLKKQDGIAIMSVMLFFTVMTLFVGTISFVSVNNVNLASVPIQSKAAFYGAEAGISVAVDYLETIKNRTDFTSNDITRELNALNRVFSPYRFYLQNNDGNPVSVTVRLEAFNIVSNTMRARITSIGSVGTHSRTLVRDVTFQFGNDVPQPVSASVRHAILVSETIINGGVTAVAGSGTPRIATFSTAQDAINIVHNRYSTVEIELPRDGVASSIIRNQNTRGLFKGTRVVTGNTLNVNVNEVRVTFPVIDFSHIRARKTRAERPPFRTDWLDGTTAQGGDFVVNDLNFSTMGISNIYVPEGVRTFIVVNGILTLGNVNVTGEGTLTIFVNPGNSTFSPGRVTFGRIHHPERLEIFIDDISGVSNNFHVEFRNGAYFGGKLMLSNGRVNFENHVTLNGSIFTGAEDGINDVQSVRINNHASNQITIANNTVSPNAFIVAPNGTVFLHNQASMRGAIIARNFVGNSSSANHSAIIFNPNLTQNIPHQIISPITDSATSVPGGQAQNSRTLTLGRTIER